MAKPQLDPEALRCFLDAGHTQADAARHFGVTEPAIHQRLKNMQRLTSQVIAFEHAGEVVVEKLTASARLENVQDVIHEELRWAVQEARREGADRAGLADVILKLAGEVRQQLGLQSSISRTLVDLRVVEEFHETVVEAIQEESPATARRIVARLKERRALRPSAELPTLTGGSDADVA